MANWQQEGKEPDYRFSLANERTFLAWIRTALALLAGGILLHQFALSLQPRWLVTAAGVGLSLFSGLLGAGAYFRWKAAEMAMRHDRPLPPSFLTPVLAGCVAVLAGAIAFFLLNQ